MNYRYDNRKKKNKTSILVGIVVLMLLLFTPVFKHLYKVVEKPLARSWQSGSQSLSNTKNFFQSWYGHAKVAKENRLLKDEITQLEIDVLHARYLEEELENIRLLQQNNPRVIPAHIIKKLSANTLILSAGSVSDVAISDIVSAYDRVLVARITEVYESSSRARMFSDPSLETNAILKEQNVVVIGHGGGSYVVKAARDIEAEVGDVVYSQEYPGYMIGRVSAINFDPRDPFKTIHVSMPVNLNTVQMLGIQNS